MPPERWGPSWGLRVLAGVQGIVGVGLLGVLLWFFFPHVLLVLWLAAAIVIQPQAGGSVVRVAAHLLIAVSWLVGAVIVLIGAVLLREAWRDRRAAPAS